MLLLIAILQTAPLRLSADTLEAANVINNQPRHAGTYVRAVSRAGDVYLITATFESERGTSYDTLAVDARTLAPRWQRVHFSTDSASIVFTGRRVSGFSQQASTGRKAINRLLPANAQPSQLAWSLVQNRTWPGTYRVAEYDHWRDTVVTVEYKPQRRRMVQHRGKSVDVWVVQNNQGALLWIDARTHQLIMRRDRTVRGGQRFDALLVRR